MFWLWTVSFKRAEVLWGHGTQGSGAVTLGHGRAQCLCPKDGAHAALCVITAAHSQPAVPRRALLRLPTGPRYVPGTGPGSDTPLPPAAWMALLLRLAQSPSLSDTSRASSDAPLQQHWQNGPRPPRRVPLPFCPWGSSSSWFPPCSLRLPAPLPGKWGPPRLNPRCCPRSRQGGRPLPR